MFLLIAFIVSIVFSGIVSAENDDDDDDSTDDEIVIELLRIRDLVLKSTNSMNSFKLISVPVSVDAEILRGELLVTVDNFDGIVEIDITGLSGGQSLHDDFLVRKSGVYGMNILPLEAGDYKLELNLGSSTYVGKFRINE